VSPLKQIVWRHLVLRPFRVWLVDSRGNVCVITRGFVQWVERLVPLSDVFVVVRPILREVVVLCTVLLYQLHILHFYGEVILVAHVVVDFVRVIWDVSDLFDVRCDGPIESSLVVALAEHMPLVHHLLPLAFLPQLFVSTSLRPDPGAPVKSFEAHHHSRQGLPLAIIDVIKSDSITILGHLLTPEERIRFLPPGLGEIVRRREARVELKGCRGGEGGRGEFLKDWLTQEGGEEGGKGRGDGGEAGEHLVLPALHSSSPLL